MLGSTHITLLQYQAVPWSKYHQWHLTGTGNPRPRHVPYLTHPANKKQPYSRAWTHCIILHDKQTRILGGERRQERRGGQSQSSSFSLWTRLRNNGWRTATVLEHKHQTLWWKHPECSVSWITEKKPFFFLTFLGIMVFLNHLGFWPMNELLLTCMILKVKISQRVTGDEEGNAKCWLWAVWGWSDPLCFMLACSASSEQVWAALSSVFSTESAEHLTTPTTQHTPHLLRGWINCGLWNTETAQRGNGWDNK